MLSMTPHGVETNPSCPLRLVADSGARARKRANSCQSRHFKLLLKQRQTAAFSSAKRLSPIRTSSHFPLSDTMAEAPENHIDFFLADPSASLPAEKKEWITAPSPVGEQQSQRRSTPGSPVVIPFGDLALPGLSFLVPGCEVPMSNMDCQAVGLVVFSP